jgi:hypothetical protein
VLAKYSSNKRFKLQSSVDPSSILGPYYSLDRNLFSLINASVASSTWDKYGSAKKALDCFAAAHCSTLAWPLDLETCRAFVVWCHVERGLRPSTITAYLSGIKFLHKLKGLKCDHISDDPILNMLLKGVEHVADFRFSKPDTRRVVTFPLLLLICHRIAKTNWSPLSKQVIYSICLTGFFTSARMGELLACQEDSHSPDSNLTWSDVRKSSPTSLLIRLKQPKSGEKAEFVDLFPFSGYDCCPVLAIENLKKLQIEAGVWRSDLPVFRFKSGKNLTQAKFNKILASLLSDVCEKGKNSITCHSFRCGIPSTVSLFPHLAQSDIIKGWGRWKSDCYSLYTRLKLPQKQSIFNQISTALHSVAPASLKSITFNS